MAALLLATMARGDARGLIDDFGVARARNAGGRLAKYSSTSPNRRAARTIETDSRAERGAAAAAARLPPKDSAGRGSGGGARSGTSQRRGELTVVAANASRWLHIFCSRRSTPVMRLRGDERPPTARCTRMWLGWGTGSPADDGRIHCGLS